MITIYSNRYDCFEQQLAGALESFGVKCTVECTEEILDETLAKIETDCSIDGTQYTYFDRQYIPLDDQDAADDGMELTIKNLIAAVLTKSMNDNQPVNHVEYENDSTDTNTTVKLFD